MIRTTSKEALNSLRTFITGSVCDENNLLSFPDYEGAAQYALSCFKRDLGGRVGEIGLVNSLVERLNGCPGCGLSDAIYWEDGAKKVLKDILKETKADLKKYKDRSATQFLFYLIARELAKFAGRASK